MADAHSVSEPHQTSIDGSLTAIACICLVEASAISNGTIAEASQNFIVRIGVLR